MFLCCVVAPVAIGVAACGIIGGWLGVACTIPLAGVAYLVLRARRQGNC
jgi:hypothetical protein